MPAQPQDDLHVDWSAFAQLTAEQLDGQDGVSFGSDRLRIASTLTYRQLWIDAELDMGGGDLGESPPGTFANVVKDLVIGYEPRTGPSFVFGQFKTPIGMDFHIGGNALDITERGLDAGLVLARGVGVMVTARSLGRGFGYDLGYFNIAGRSTATAYPDSQDREGNAFAARGLFTSKGPWHAEVSYGETAEAGGPGTADYRVKDVGFIYGGEPWTAKFEWIEGRGVRGDPNRTEAVYYLHAGYEINDAFEVVARHYDGTSRIGGVSTDLGNTYLGLSWYPVVHERTQARLQFNYVVSAGDELAYTGVLGFRDDAILVQFQIQAEK